MKSRKQLGIFVSIVLAIALVPAVVLATSASISVSGTEGYATISASGSFTKYEYCNNPEDPTDCTYNENGGISVYRNDPVWGESRIARVNGQGSATWTGQIDIGLLEQGTHEFSVHATDAEGIVATDTATINVDNTPSVTIDSPGEVKGGWVDITGTATFKEVGDPNSHDGDLVFYLDGNRLDVDSFRIFTTQINYSRESLSGNLIDAGLLANGEHTLSVYAYSRLGPSASDSVTFTVDNTPTVTVDSPGLVKGGGLDITGSATFTDVGNPDYFDGSLQFYLDGNKLDLNSFRIFSTSINYSRESLSGNLIDAGFLSNGEHTLATYAYSRLGASDSDSATFEVDNTPSGSVDSPGTVRGGWLDFTGTVEFADVYKSDQFDGEMSLYLDGNRLRRDSFRFFTTSTDWRYSELGGSLVNAAR